MSSIGYEQENQTLNQISDQQINQKMQTSVMNSNSKVLTKGTKSPINKGLKASDNCFKASNKSSRKAFGNVSNVLHSSHKMIAKQTNVNKTEVKESESSKIDEMKANDENETKFFDEIEDMHPIEEELLSAMTDPITANLYTIDEDIILNMGFDSDFDDSLLPTKRSHDFNDFF